MKFLVMEIENYPVNWSDVDPGLLKEEARFVYDLQQTDLIRQIYFRGDTHSAVMEWECESMAIVREKTTSFPLVRAGLIHFDILPLQPYTGFSRLFG